MASSTDASQSNEKVVNPADHELKVYSAEELAKYNKKALVADVGLLEGNARVHRFRPYLKGLSVERLRNAKVDLNVLKEYRKREKEFLERAQDLERITNLRDGSKKKYDDLRKSRLDQFMLGFKRHLFQTKGKCTRHVLS